MSQRGMNDRRQLAQASRTRKRSRRDEIVEHGEPEPSVDKVGSVVVEAVDLAAVTPAGPDAVEVILEESDAEALQRQVLHPKSFEIARRERVGRLHDRAMPGVEEVSGDQRMRVDRHVARRGYQRSRRPAALPVGRAGDRSGAGWLADAVGAVGRLASVVETGQVVPLYRFSTLLVSPQIR